MKLLPNKTFPHPVLRENADDYTRRQFQATRHFKIREDIPVLSFHFTINEEAINNLLKKEKAIYFLEIYCLATFVRHVFQTEKNSGEFALNKGDLYRQVEVNAFVICTKCVENYSSLNFNKEFGESPSFNLNPGDVLATTDTVFYDWDTEVVKPLTSVFDIVANDNITRSMYEVDTSGDKINIQMHSKDKERFDQMRHSSENKRLALFAYFPLVVEILRQMHDAKSDSDKDTKWYRSIEYKIGELGKNLESSDPFILAQELLGKPLECILPKAESNA